MKTCTLCKQELAYDKFGKDSKMKDGRLSACRECTNARARASYYKSEVARNFKYTQRYGITYEEVIAMAEAQDYLCKICDKKCAFLNGNRGNAFHIDHCHTTNKVRGLICATCNRGLGLFYDSPEFLRRAADYLVTSF